MKHKCNGCGQRKDSYCETPGGGSLCSGCAASFGMKGHGPNRAEANSRAWQAKPCQHQSVRYAYESRFLTNYQVSICNRCGKEVTRLIVGYHSRGRR